MEVVPEFQIRIVHAKEYPGERHIRGGKAPELKHLRMFSSKYPDEEEISCPGCHHERTPEERARYAERQRQIKLAKKRGEKHIGR